MHFPFLPFHAYPPILFPVYDLFLLIVFCLCVCVCYYIFNYNLFRLNNFTYMHIFFRTDMLFFQGVTSPCQGKTISPSLDILYLPLVPYEELKPPGISLVHICSLLMSSSLRSYGINWEWPQDPLLTQGILSIQYLQGGLVRECFCFLLYYLSVQW